VARAGFQLVKQPMTFFLLTTARAGVITLLCFSHLVSSSLTCSSQNVDDLLQWIEEEDGYFNPKQEIRPEIPGDPTSRLGIFAKERIEKGAVLAHIPWDVMIKGNDEDFDDDDYEDKDEEPDDNDSTFRIACDTVRNLVREIKLDKESEYRPYVSYLLAQKQGQLPSSWSEAGKKLFLEVLGGEGNQELLMNDSVDLLDSDWFELCGGDKSDDLSANAAMLVKQHSDYGMMIPLKDLYTHRNGPWYNTETRVIEGEAYQFLAGRTIEAGEQIHDSINKCEDCQEYDEDYGTPGKFEIM
jgi:hypothetical protein